MKGQMNGQYGIDRDRYPFSNEFPLFGGKALYRLEEFPPNGLIMCFEHRKVEINTSWGIHNIRCNKRFTHRLTFE